MMFFVFSGLAIAQDDAPIVGTYADQDEILDMADVRGFIWGLPPDIIKKEEKGTFVQEDPDGTLYYVDRARGIKFSITYEFKDNKLYKVQMFSVEKYSVPQKRIDDLIKIKRDLDQRFGEPIKEDFNWVKDYNKKHPDQWGWAVYSQDLFITMEWQNTHSFVTAYLGTPKMYDTVLAVTFEDIQTKKQATVDEAKENMLILP